MVADELVELSVLSHSGYNLVCSLDRITLALSPPLYKPMTHRATTMRSSEDYLSDYRTRPTPVPFTTNRVRPGAQGLQVSDVSDELPLFCTATIILYLNLLFQIPIRPDPSFNFFSWRFTALFVYLEWWSDKYCELSTHRSFTTLTNRNPLFYCLSSCIMKN